jgi:hypothetical protein
LPTDYESYLNIQISTINNKKLILSVGNEIRTVIDGPLQYLIGYGDKGTVVNIELSENEIYRYVNVTTVQYL